MKFYRLAEKSDFEKAELVLKDFDFPEEVIHYIKNEGDLRRAAGFLHSKRNYSIQQAQHACNEYWSILKARDDFRKGVQVYTEY